MHEKMSITLQSYQHSEQLNFPHKFTWTFTRERGRNEMIRSSYPISLIPLYLTSYTTLFLLPVHLPPPPPRLFHLLATAVSKNCRSSFHNLGHSRLALKTWSLWAIEHELLLSVMQPSCPFRAKQWHCFVCCK